MLNLSGARDDSTLPHGILDSIEQLTEFQRRAVVHVLWGVDEDSSDDE